jgi:hypothetical protein
MGMVMVMEMDMVNLRTNLKKIRVLTGNFFKFKNKLSFLKCIVQRKLTGVKNKLKG